jgi:YidC/Oxa1 family membrane protein insertase
MPLVYANIFQPLIDVFESLLVFIHDNIGGSWGLSIIGLTVVVRAVLVPLTLKQFRSMQSLQRLAPQMKELQAKYKDDRQRLNQEMMKLYQENKVNPFGSCLPLLLQMPVFLALFYLLREDLKLDICGDALRAAGKASGKALEETACGDPGIAPDSAKFAFIPDLTEKATGSVLIALILLYIGSQLASSLLMSVTADRNQRMLMIGLPFIFTIFIIQFPAGLIVYWITTNLWTVGQQYIVRRTVGPLRPPEVKGAPATAAAVASGGGGRGGGGGSGGGAPKSGGGAPKSGGGKPPPPPRKKKKRSGRRR